MLSLDVHWNVCLNFVFSLRELSLFFSLSLQIKQRSFILCKVMDKSDDGGDSPNCIEGETGFDSNLMKDNSAFDGAETNWFMNSENQATVNGTPQQVKENNKLSFLQRIHEKIINHHELINAYSSGILFTGSP